ncbi:flagellar protein FlgN [Aquibacillus salsiterrae]|uniref:Flagellar protein FlgN n=1 Tax=Aquibacillus salsiterrae TaxID=2950439 RepID=A0A9X4AFD6_9BACI|nr:flagellar protein FlgN [Aquibacillus salsiterrae]MDC3416125.1 flagellar protein FlgN [Aquibacillus salsiterrae]
MSVQAIVDTLTKITQLHHSLLSVSQTKTEVLKEGDTAKLQTLLVQERKHVQAIEQLELKRIDLVKAWATANKQDTDTTTVSAMLDVLTDGHEKELLEQATVGLVDVLVSLRSQEQLNHELTQQSLQYIELSLNMLSPSLKHLNYNNQSTQTTVPNRSLFDSKA